MAKETYVLNLDHDDVVILSIYLNQTFGNKSLEDFLNELLAKEVEELQPLIKRRIDLD